MDRRNFTRLISVSALWSGRKFWQNMEENKKPKQKPLLLKEGDMVGLIAPSGPISDAKIINAVTNMEKLGLRPVVGEAVYKKHGFLAGDDDLRLGEIHRMFEDPQIRAVWCLRGGYGSTRLLPMLDYGLIKKNPKIFIGYSDVTALLMAFSQKANLVCFHGPVAISQVFSPITFQAVKSMLFGESSHFNLDCHMQTEDKFKQAAYTIMPGIAEGPLIGGNLSLLASLAGTPYAPSYKGKIVFIEDVGEKPYRLDRMMTQLKQGSDLEKANGIIFGVFHNCEPEAGDYSFNLKETIVNSVKYLNIPCFYGFPFGHVSDMVTLPIGINATMDASLKTIGFSW